MEIRRATPMSRRLMPQRHRSLAAVAKHSTVPNYRKNVPSLHRAHLPNRWPQASPGRG